MEQGRAEQVLSISKLQNDLNDIHKDVKKTTDLRRKKAISAHNKATNIVVPSFSIEDFVCVRRAHDRGPKLKFKWYGPCKITAVHSPLVYSVTSLHNNKSQRVHSTRLTKYRDSLNDLPVSEQILDLSARTESRYEVIERLLDVAEADDGFYFQVQ